MRRITNAVYLATEALFRLGEHSFSMTVRPSSIPQGHYLNVVKSEWIPELQTFRVIGRIEKSPPLVYERPQRKTSIGRCESTGGGG